MKLVIETSEANIRMMLRGMDILIRAHMGQLTAFANELRVIPTPKTPMPELYDQIERCLREVETEFNGMDSGYPSISNPALHENARMIFDLYSTIRHEIDNPTSIYKQELCPLSSTPVQVALMDAESPQG
jgi:hypothetical protein